VLRDCPAKLDVLFVPGGFGTFEAIKDAELIEFLKTRSPTTLRRFAMVH
jgi:cyclohexyl-isocyanide hydratase